MKIIYKPTKEPYPAHNYGVPALPKATNDHVLNASSAFATPEDSRLETALEIRKSQLSERKKQRSPHDTGSSQRFRHSKRYTTKNDDAIVKVA